MAVNRKQKQIYFYRGVQTSSDYPPFDALLLCQRLASLASSDRYHKHKDGKQITFRVRGQTEALPITVIIGKQPVDEAGFDDEDDFVPIPREDRSLRLTERTHVVFFPHSGIVGAELNNRGAYMSQFADLINDKLPNLAVLEPATVATAVRCSGRSTTARGHALAQESYSRTIDQFLTYPRHWTGSARTEAWMAAATDWESPCVASSLLRPSLDHHTAVPNCCFAYPQMIGVGNRSCRGLAATVSFIVIARLVALKPAPVMALSM
jgi:hypothetical protein